MNIIFIQQLMNKELKPEEKEFLKKLENEHAKGTIPSKFYHIFLSFFNSYSLSINGENNDYLKVFYTYFELCKKNIQKPFEFDHYHQKIRKPFDYYQFGLDLLTPLVDKAHSKVVGGTNIEQALKNLKNNENVILLANHQTETDPQAISLLLEDQFPSLGEKIIYVAGERVVTDPIAIPASMGCDLLCIYSKKYIDTPLHLKHEKQIHNTKTMQKMQSLLSEGGKIIYVAPSGGRDRPGPSGAVEVAPFDPQSIEMFYLMAKKSHKNTHFYPLTLSTYHILPPPDQTQKELGEQRFTKKAPIFLFWGEEIHMESFDSIEDKKERRKIRCDAILKKVMDQYQILLTYEKPIHN